MKISVITVCYNAAETIEKTIQSVLGQTYRDIEYIIIDGGSTDGTIDVIRKYADKIAYWTSEPDKGIYDAMNKGIRVATGEWINFMNSGDYFSSDAVVENIFQKNSYAGVDVVYGNTWMKYAKGISFAKVKKIDYMQKGMPFCHQSSFVRRDAIGQFDTNYRIAADYHFFYMSYLEKGTGTFRYIDMPVAVFDARDGVSANVINTYEEYLLVRKVGYRQIRVALFKVIYTFGKRCKKLCVRFCVLLTNR